MRTNRTSLFAYVAIAALGVAATSMSASEAAAGIFCGKFGGFAGPRNFTPAPAHRERVVVRRPPPPAASKPVVVVEKAAPRKPASAEPSKLAGTASIASTASTAAAAAEVAQAAGTANAARTATPCLTKQYLETGAVMFKDACTNEWAINSTTATATGQKASLIGGNCLTKENHPDGVVMFKDTCTKEWAMNTAERLAEAPPTR
jgi:hypothetical protein